MARNTAARRSAGFTLIEVLLVLLLMSGILLTMTQILNAARTSRDQIHNIQETQLAGPAILDMIERDLRGILTYNRPRTEMLRVKDRTMLGLDGDSLDFIATTDSLVLNEDGDRFVRADVNEIGYRLRPRLDNDDFLELYRREDFGIDDEPFEGGQFTFLHDRVKALDILVFSEEGPDAEPIEEWGVDEQDPDTQGLPIRIEITLTLEMAPRLVKEALIIVPVERRTRHYRRHFRFPESLRLQEGEQVVLGIPEPGEGTAPEALPGGGGDLNGATDLTGSSGGGSGNRGGGGSRTSGGDFPIGDG